MEERAAQLASRVSAVTDPELRVAYVRHELGLMTPEEVADLVLLAAGRVATREPPHPELMLSISLALADPASEATRRAAVRAAAERGLMEVVLLLGRVEAEDEGGAMRVPDFGLGRPLTLGERKSIARRNDRNLILRVLRDPHPDVIHIVLGNPALTEDDVVRLCAHRPIAGDVLRVVFRSTRWIVRYRIRRTIVLNPFTPRDVALQLATHLTAQDARLVRESKDLPEELRRACERQGSGAPIH